MSVGVIDGTLERPAAGFFLLSAAIGAVNARRLTGAALAVVGLHVALLTFRPGAAPGNFVAPSASPVMAVRVLQSPPDLAAASSGSPAAPTVAAPGPVVPTPALAEPLAGRWSIAHCLNGARPQPLATSTAPIAADPSGRAGAAQDESSPAPPPPRRTRRRGADAPLAAAPDYAFGVRLDPGPRPLSDIEPDYPDMAHLREGVVVLRLLISERGAVDNVAVVRAEPRGIFEQAAIEAFSKARFSPGLAAGTPVKSQITVEVQFMPINRGARVSGKTY